MNRYAPERYCRLSTPGPLLSGCANVSMRLTHRTKEHTAYQQHQTRAQLTRRSSLSSRDASPLYKSQPWDTIAIMGISTMTCALIGSKPNSVTNAFHSRFVTAAGPTKRSTLQTTQYT